LSLTGYVTVLTIGNRRRSGTNQFFRKNGTAKPEGRQRTSHQKSEVLTLQLVRQAQEVFVLDIGAEKVQPRATTLNVTVACEVKPSETGLIIQVDVVVLNDDCPRSGRQQVDHAVRSSISLSVFVGKEDEKFRAHLRFSRGRDDLEILSVFGSHKQKHRR
jgi:hypothetical protein